MNLKKSKYDDKLICPKCGEQNKIEVKDRMSTDILEAETICHFCGHTDYWAHGFYQSKSEVYQWKKE